MIWNFGPLRYSDAHRYGKPVCFVQSKLFFVGRPAVGVVSRMPGPTKFSETKQVLSGATRVAEPSLYDLQVSM